MTMASFNLKTVCFNFGKLSIAKVIIRSNSNYKPPRFRPPYWYTQKDRVMSESMLTQDNKKFIEDVMKERLNNQKAMVSPLAQGEGLQVSQQWDRFTRRTGLIGRKIGNYPLWLKNGKKVQTTLVQVSDNHVIKYIPPEEFKPMITTKYAWKEKRRLGCLLVGSESVDPSTVTKDYSSIFDNVGMMPKRHLCRFMVSPHASLTSGTPLYATHFRVGDYLDVRAKTIDRGFQGVMKRWGFKGMPASHGVTKTHRRPGNIGAGGNKARVWPGTKMPGHMGNRWRTLRGVKVLRMDTKHNVMWLLGVGIPGETGSLCYLFDTVLPNHKLKAPPPFPTHPYAEDLPLELYDESVHPFSEPTITYEEV